MYSYADQDHWTIVSGQKQSPVNIETSQAKRVFDLPRFKGHQIQTIQNLGYKLSLAGVGHAQLQGRNATFQELHFHHPSEHHLDGQAAALEAHFVHQFVNGSNAVVAICFNLGAENAQLTQILSQVPAQTKTQQLGKAIDLSSWFQATAYYHYVGSLTTPPVLEGIEWYIAATPLTLSKAQLGQFEQCFAPNNRHIQPLNQRQILRLQ